MSNNLIYGVDVGGTGIKGAIIDVTSGELMTERIKIKTPKPPEPGAILDVIEELISIHKWEGPVGCGFPSVIDRGICRTATNMSNKWIGQNVAQLISDRIKQPIIVLNDADAAALCEHMYGAAKDMEGTILMITVGTGIGSAIIRNGVMIPNLEFGSLYMDNGLVLEQHISNAVRKREKLSWSKFGKRFNEVLNHLCFIMNPDHIILGGGVVKYYSEFRNCLESQNIISLAEFGNAAGCIGAAAAYHLQQK